MHQVHGNMVLNGHGPTNLPAKHVSSRKELSVLKDMHACAEWHIEPKVGSGHLGKTCGGQHPP